MISCATPRCGRPARTARDYCCDICEFSGKRLYRSATHALACDDANAPPEAHARSTDPQTSHDAAASVRAAEIRETQRDVLHLLKTVGPMTDEELIEAFGRVKMRPQSRSGLRTRRSELVTQGLVEDSGVRRPTASNRKATVWRAVP